jgi:hypothetical protein
VGSFTLNNISIAPSTPYLLKFQLKLSSNQEGYNCWQIMSLKKEFVISNYSLDDWIGFRVED